MMADNDRNDTPISDIENIEEETEKADQAAETAEKASDAAEKAAGEKTGKGKRTAKKNPVPEIKKAAEDVRNKLTRKQAPKKSISEIQNELVKKRKALVHSSAEMSAKLKQMLSDEIEAYSKREKRRSAEILAVFAKHNFYANGFTPEELRTTLEDLGPTYVKIGQIMSSRVDILPESYCRELEKLRQNVKPLDAEVARAVIEQETGRSIDEIYSEFRDKPLGSASIGQAHYGVLKDGTRVVTKVQRPLIADMMRKDFVLLKKLASMLGAVNGSGDDGKGMVDLTSVLTELEKVTEDELDFRVEAQNTRFFKENCIEDEQKVNCPTVIDELTTERIFTMTFVDGYSVSKHDRLVTDGYDPNEIGKALVENYVHQVLDVGTFHGDPHQGNIMVCGGVPYWIDFGMIGRITEEDINNIQSLILAMLQGDLETMVNSVISLGASSPNTNRNKLLEDIDAFYSKYMSVTSISDLDMAVLLTEITDLAAANHITLPGKYTMLVRSIATVEGVIEQLCPELNLFKIISDKMMERAKKNFDVSQSLLSAGKDAMEMGKKTARIPLLAHDALNSVVKGRTKINVELTGYEELSKKLSGTVLNLVLALFACVLFIGAALLTNADITPKISSGMPLVSAACFVFSIALGIFAIKRLSKNK